MLTALSPSATHLPPPRTLTPTETSTPRPTATRTPTPAACGANLIIRDLSTALDPRHSGVIDILEDLELCGQNITLTLRNGPHATEDNTWYQFGEAETRNGEYTIWLRLPHNYRDYEWGRHSNPDTHIEYVARHEFRHIWQFVYAWNMREAQAERDADVYAGSTRSNALLVRLSPPATATPSCDWVCRKWNDLMDRWDAWVARWQERVSPENYMLDGFWDAFCGDGWMYRELHDLRPHTSGAMREAIDHALTVDHYHELLCQGGGNFSDENWRAMWDALDRMNDAVRRTS